VLPGRMTRMFLMSRSAICDAQVRLRRHGFSRRPTSCAPIAINSPSVQAAAVPVAGCPNLPPPSVPATSPPVATRNHVALSGDKKSRRPLAATRNHITLWPREAPLSPAKAPLTAAAARQVGSLIANASAAPEGTARCSRSYVKMGRATDVTGIPIAQAPPASAGLFFPAIGA
jgi:hypothetical protein